MKEGVWKKLQVSEIFGYKIAGERALIQYPARVIKTYCRKGQGLVWEISRPVRVSIVMLMAMCTIVTHEISKRPELMMITEISVTTSPETLTSRNGQKDIKITWLDQGYEAESLGCIQELLSIPRSAQDFHVTHKIASPPHACTSSHNSTLQISYATGPQMWCIHAS